jgi:hypothetical protein
MSKLKSNENNSSESNSEKKANKVAKAISIRNRFFFILYRHSTLVFLTSLLSMLASIGFFIFFAKQPVPPQYIPINEDGTYIKLEPLSQCKEDKDVQKFVLTAINKMYKYDYINYPSQIQEAMPYFTGAGWNEYLDEYSKSNTLLAVKENKWVVSVTPSGVPLIVKQYVENDICTWEVKTPLSLIYAGNNAQNPQGDIYMRVVRNSVINNPEGLGIRKVVFVENR